MIVISSKFKQYYTVLCVSTFVALGQHIYERNVSVFRSVASEFSMLKPTKVKRRIKSYLAYSSYITFQIANNNGADQTARMRRLVCAFVVSK